MPVNYGRLQQNKKQLLQKNYDLTACNKVLFAVCGSEKWFQKQEKHLDLFCFCFVSGLRKILLFY